MSFAAPAKEPGSNTTFHFFLCNSSCKINYLCRAGLIDPARTSGSGEQITFLFATMWIIHKNVCPKCGCSSYIVGNTLKR